MKILNLQKYLREKKISFALFFNFEDKENPNYYYLSSYEGYGALLVPQDGKATLFTAEMEWEKASKTVKEKNICVKRYKKKLLPMLKEIIKGKKKLGVDKSQITVEFYYRLKKFFKGKKLMDIAEPCRQLRAVKNDREIEYLRKACSISDSIISRCIGNFKKFKTEMDVSNFLGDETIRRGCKLAFPAIVASGSGSSQPHYVPRKIRLKKGFCVIDFGVVYHGYRSDTTRTVYLGKPSLKETDMYDLLLNTQLETAKHVKENIICSKLYDKCVSELGRYSKYYIYLGSEVTSSQKMLTSCPLTYLYILHLCRTIHHFYFICKFTMINICRAPIPHT